MEKGNISFMILIDLSAAFDMVDHSILLRLLEEKFNIRGNLLKWFDSYLRPRGFVVNVNDQYSAFKELKCSVPQGSLNGTYPYLAYASTSEKVINDKFNIYGFVDDHAIRAEFKQININESDIRN